MPTLGASTSWPDAEIESDAGNDAGLPAGEAVGLADAGGCRSEAGMVDVEYPPRGGTRRALVT